MKEDRDILRKGGFAEGEAIRLSKLKKEHIEREKRQEQAYHRRLEFVRWLVVQGKLTDQIA